jgi:3-hydroxybutyryl-CoA dehydrogenase
MDGFSRVAVLGAGTMGPGIAAVFAAAGFQSSIFGRRERAAERAAAQAEKQWRVLVDHGLASPGEMRIRPAHDLDDALGDAEIVIEAVSEDLETKRSVFAEVEQRVDSDVVLGSTTSGLDIDLISATAEHPARFLVLHFWNPAHLIPLVEVVGGKRTDPAIVDGACALLRRIGKHPVRLNKYVPGFVGVRLQQAVVREAIALLQAGVASAEDIDAATRLSFGARFPVIGPLETSDLGGLDVIAAIHEYLLADLDCSREPQALLKELVSAGDLGAKTGRGFYDWANRDAGELSRHRDEELITRIKSLHERGQLGV